MSQLVKELQALEQKLIMIEEREQILLKKEEALKISENQLTKDYQELEQEVTSLERNIQSLENQRANLRKAESNWNNKKASETKSFAKKLLEEKNKLRVEVYELNNQVTSLNSKIEEREEHFKKLMSALETAKEKTKEEKENVDLAYKSKQQELERWESKLRKGDKQNLKDMIELGNKQKKIEKSKKIIWKLLGVILLVIIVGVILNVVLFRGYLSSDKIILENYNEALETYNHQVNDINLEFDNQIEDIQQVIYDNESNFKYQNYIDAGCVEDNEADYSCSMYEDKYNEVVNTNKSNENAIENLETQREEQKKELVKPQEPKESNE